MGHARRLTNLLFAAHLCVGVGFLYVASGCGDGSSSADASTPRVDAMSLTTCGVPGGTDRHPVEADALVGCERYLGSFDFAFSPVTDCRDLESLRWIDGTLNFLSNGELVSLTGLEQLEHLGELTIRSAPLLEDLAPLGSLRVVEGRVFISANDSLGSLHGLEQVEEMGELILRIHPDHTDALTLTVLESMTTIRGDASFRNVRREEVDAFLERVDVGGTVTFDGEVIVEGAGDAGP